MGDEWRRECFDDVIDRQVDEAIGEAGATKSGGSAVVVGLEGRAQELDLRPPSVSTVVRAIKAGIERIATGVGKEGRQAY